MTVAPRRPGWLIAVEGVDGAGKSTFTRALVRTLRSRGRSVGSRREPTNSTLGALAQRASVEDPWAGAVYFTLDRFLARNALTHDLARYEVVVSDRSFYSTLAYQGSALRATERRRLTELQRRATVVPHRVVLLDLTPAEALRRLGSRASPRGPLERRRVLARVAREYRNLARRGRWMILDARRPTADLVRTAVAALEADLPASRGGSSRRRR